MLDLLLFMYNARRSDCADFSHGEQLIRCKILVLKLFAAKHFNNIIYFVVDNFSW